MGLNGGGVIVIDASVAVKWIVTEPGNAAAMAVFESTSTLVAPDLVAIEVAGAIARRGRERHLSPTLVREAYQVWTQLIDQEMLTLRPSITLIDRAFEMAVQIGHPVADCVYLACAEQLEATVLTADHTMHTRGLKAYGRIELLSKAA